MTTTIDHLTLPDLQTITPWLAKEEGSFDHITWVTMTETGPRIANIVLDGILGAEGGVFRPTPMFATLTQV